MISKGNREILANGDFEARCNGSPSQPLHAMLRGLGIGISSLFENAFGLRSMAHGDCFAL